MTIHLVKLSVGSESVESLARWQLKRLEARRAAGEAAELVHRTRMYPRRADELLAGGSIYWVIRGAILARQAIRALRRIETADGIKRCEIVLDPALVAVYPTPRRAFQGWRYLEPEDAPPDLASEVAGALATLPAGMRADLLELGLI